MAIRIKKGGWTALGLIAILGAGGVFMKVNHDHPEWFNRAKGVEAFVPQEVKLGDVQRGADTVSVDRPTYSLAEVKRENAGTLRVRAIGWNAQIGAIYANGGPSTAAGSLMERMGVQVDYGRQDDYVAQQGELFKFAEAFASGEQDPSVGAQFSIIMGDGAPYYLYGLQKQLDKYGLHATIIGATGFSRGEDKCMGQAEWAKDPQKAKGALISAVIMDGDQHICNVWAQIHGIKVNPDPNVYRKDAINYLKVGSVKEAGEAYLSGNDPKHGICKKYDDGQKACVNGTAVWTPVDVEVVEGKGGLVTLLSTAETRGQMAATIITIKEWARQNPATVTNFLQAALNGGAVVATDRQKLRQAAAWSAQVWGEYDGNWWLRYYNGVTQNDPQTGEEVRLGGSQAIGLATNLQYFRTTSGPSVFDGVYNAFCAMDRSFYPDDLPSCPKDVVDTFFLEQIAAKAGNIGQGTIISNFTGSESETVAAAPHSIQFEQGSDVISPASYGELRTILGQINLLTDYAVVIEGYTSSEGGNAVNLPLSKRRAQAVMQWLSQNAPAGVITSQRVRAVGRGSQDLVLDASGREDALASRRVVVRFTK